MFLFLRNKKIFYTLRGESLMVSTFQPLVRTAQLSMGEALQVTAIGLAVVFAILAILIMFIELLHLTVNISGRKKESKAPEKQVANGDDGKRISAGVTATVPTAADAGSDAEFIAAVSAAISVATGRDNGSFTIKSIKEK